MISMSSFLKTSNPIVRVNFAGFESDTLTLQRNGWDLSVEQMMDRAAMRLAMRHEKAGLFALTHSVSFNAMASLQDSSYWNSFQFNIMWCGSNAEFHIIPQVGGLSFEPFDAMPSWEIVDSVKRIMFKDAIPFKTLNTDAPEILIAPNSVPELMDMILKMQDPKQAEIREKRRIEAVREGQLIGDGNLKPAVNVVGSIITLCG